MVTRPHLALVPANGLSPRARTAVLRALVVLALAAVLAAVGYLAARQTSLFALRELEVTGGSQAVNEAVHDAAGPFLGESLVSLDRDQVRERLVALPTVRAVRLDRAFPHSLRVVVTPEQALAVVRNGREAWLVSERGRVMRAASAAAKGRPLIWTVSEPDLRPGGWVQGERVRSSLRALRALPAGFPERIATARADDSGITFLLADGTELRLGPSDQLALKLAVAATILERVPASERAGLAYLDVSVPERVVGGSTLNSQLEG